MINLGIVPSFICSTLHNIWQEISWYSRISYIQITILGKKKGCWKVLNTAVLNLSSFFPKQYDLDFNISFIEVVQSLPTNIICLNADEQLSFWLNFNPALQVIWQLKQELLRPKALH